MSLPSINKNIADAQTMHSDFYTEDKFFNLSISKIFSHSWQFVVIENQLDKFGIFPFNFLASSINEPMILTRPSDCKIICLSNVCTHRGSIICDQESDMNFLRCPYHGRTFNLNGELKVAPGFKGVNDFPHRTDNLKRYNIMLFKNLIFTALDPKINISPILKDIESRLGWFEFNSLDYNHQSSSTYYLDAHWSLYCENYLEGFHVPYVHKGLNDSINLGSYKTELLENGILQSTYGTNIEDNMVIPAGFKDEGKYIYAYYYFIFPNIMLNFYHWGLSINIIEPISKNRTRIRFLSYPKRKNIQPVNSEASLDRVEKEDQNIILNVQQGIQSQSYSRGRYSIDYEEGVHHYHRLISEYIS